MTTFIRLGSDGLPIITVTKEGVQIEYCDSQPIKWCDLDAFIGLLNATIQMEALFED